MRIAYIVADRYISVFGSKGASIHVQELVKAFASLGHEVTLVVARCGDGPNPLPATIVEVPIQHPSAVPSDLSGDTKRRAKEQHALNIGVEMECRLRELHHEHGFDLIYERYSLFSHAGVRAGRELGVPTIVEVNAPLLEEQRKYRKLCHVEEATAIAAEIFNEADALLPVSKQVADYLISNGADPCRVHVLPNAVDAARFHPGVNPRALPEADGRVVVGFVGSLKPWHGIGILMPAFARLNELSSDYHLLIVGDGPLADWIDGFATGAGLDNRVTVTGWIPNDTLPETIGGMDIAVAPYPDIDGFYFSPLKLFEYMAMGRPLVASSMGQLADVIEDGVSGLLARPGDPTHLAECIDSLRVNESLRGRLSRGALERVHGQTWERNVRRIVDIATPLLRAA